MAAKCNACGKYVSAADVAGCCTCKKIHHRGCVNLSRSSPVSSSWQCPDCKTSTKGITPFRGAVVQGEERNRDQNVSAIIGSDSVLATELHAFRNEMRETREEFRSARLEMQELRERLGACEERLTCLEGRISVLEKQVGAEGATGTGNDLVRKLENTVQQLQSDLNQRDQELLRNDVEITGIPEDAGENATHLVLAVANKLGLALDERELVSCVRAGAPRVLAQQGSDSRTNRPRPIVVRLARRATRDSILSAARVRRRLNTEGLGLRGDSNNTFYINERLTRTNRDLFNRARTARRENGWRYVWTRDGKVLARKEVSSPIFRIRSEADLSRVFAVAQISRED